MIIDTIFFMLILFTQYNPQEDDLSSDNEAVVPDSERECPVILQGLIPAVLIPQESTSGKWPYIATNIFPRIHRTRKRLSDNFPPGFFLRIILIGKFRFIPR